MEKKWKIQEITTQFNPNEDIKILKKWKFLTQKDINELKKHIEKQDLDQLISKILTFLRIYTR